MEFKSSINNFHLNLIAMFNSSMKATFLLVMLMICAASCAPKYGCPANGKNVGAERILEGGKVPKAKKMKV